MSFCIVVFLVNMLVYHLYNKIYLLGLTYIFNFWHSGTLALSPERQSARMSEIKNVA